MWTLPLKSSSVSSSRRLVTRHLAAGSHLGLAGLFDDLPRCNGTSATCQEPICEITCCGHGTL